MYCSPLPGGETLKHLGIRRSALKGTLESRTHDVHYPLLQSPRDGEFNKSQCMLLDN